MNYYITSYIAAVVISFLWYTSFSLEFHTNVGKTFAVFVSSVLKMLKKAIATP